MKANKDNYEIMTGTPVEKLILKFSIPTILTMLVNNIYNLVDTAFVGKLGTSQSGAIGIVFGFMTILQAVGFMFGQGCGSMISRALGKKDVEAASKTASTGICMALLLGFLTSIICFMNLGSLIRLLGSSDTIFPYARTYITYILITAPLNVAGFTMNNILRYEGKAFYGMIGMMSGAILNIAGDAILMFGFGMGIAGAGLSTSLSQIVSFILLLSAFLRGKTSCRLAFKNVSITAGHIYEIVATGFPSMLRQGLNSVTAIMLNTYAGVYGDEAIAAFSIVSRIFFFIFAIAIGIGQGFQPVSGFNYGAKRYDRVKKAYRFTIILSEVCIFVLGTLVFIFAPELIYMCRADMNVVEIGTRALRLHCICGLVMPFCMSTEMLLQSTGKKLSATILSAFRGGILFIPALVILSNVRGLSGIQEAQPLAFLLGLIPAILYSVRFVSKKEH
ncbi:MAG: MATE family efflux transporter [Lachnospiraceae bacterium]|nr:MATE family efflux transporter [Lachnospiraceae bacterium]